MASFADNNSATFGQPQSNREPGPLSERRPVERALRRRVIKGVRISFQNDYCAVEGVMKNVSDSGALIELKDGYLIPDIITIYDELAGYKVEAEVVRRNTNRIGIRFVGEKEPIEQKRAQVVMEIGLPGEEPEEEPETESEDQTNEPQPGQEKPTLRRRPVFGKLGTR